MNCTITILKITEYEDLIERFGSPERAMSVSAPGLSEGQVFHSDGVRPENLPEDLWLDVQDALRSRAADRRFVALLGDGFCPVTALIETGGKAAAFPMKPNPAAGEVPSSAEQMEQVLPDEPALSDLNRLLRREESWIAEPYEEGVILRAYVGEEPLAGEVDLPEELGGKPVVALANRLFYECKMITGLRVPASVRKLGEAMCAICNRLRWIEIPESVTEIPADCFNECGFRELRIPPWIRTIRRGAFVNNRLLETVQLPPEITEIPLMTFSGCKALRKIEVPDAVQSIGDGAFSGCEALARVKLPDGIRSIGMMAFLKCLALSEVEVPEETVVGDIAFPEGTAVIRKSCSARG